MSIILNNLPTSLNIGSKTFKFQAFRKAFQKLLLRFKIRRCGLFVAVALFLILLILFVNSTKVHENKEILPQSPKRLYKMNLDKINKLVSIAEKDGEAAEDENLQELLKKKDKLAKDSKLLSFFNNQLGNNVEVFAKLNNIEHNDDDSSENRQTD